MELDNHNIVSIPVTCDGSAYKAEVGFNPRKVEVVAAGGACAIAYKGATAAMKLTTAAALATGLVTFNGDNTVTLGTDAALNVSGAVTTLLCYK
jgi:hypothetical protein